MTTFDRLWRTVGVVMLMAGGFLCLIEIGRSIALWIALTGFVMLAAELRSAVGLQMNCFFDWLISRGRR